jgi:hypothetical protein
MLRVSSKTRVRAAQILKPIAVAIGGVGAIIGNCYTVAAMVLLIVSQVVNYRTNRDRRE